MLLSLLAAYSVLQAPVTVPFRLADDAILIDAKVNGRPVSLMLDTGFSGQVILNSAIDIGAPSDTATMRDFVGEFQAPIVKLKSLEVGTKSLPVKNSVVIQQPLNRMTRSYNTHADGLLGLGAMSDSIFTIDFAHQVLTFEPDSYDVTKFKPDGKTTFLAKMLPIGRSAIMMPVVTASGKWLVMTLDTGNGFFATTHRDVLERVRLWQEDMRPKFQHVSGIASGPVTSWSARLRNVSVFGVPVASSIWDVIDRPSGSAESDGTIGFQFLKNFTVTVDLLRRRVWLQNTTGEFGSEEIGEPGFLAGYDPRRRVERIFTVAPGGPADVAGVQVDDVLISVGDVNLTTQHERQIEKLLKGPVGSTVSIAVSHFGELKRYDLKRVSLVNDTP